MTFVKNLVRCIDSNNKSRFKKSHPTTYNYNNSIALLNYCTFVLCGTHSMWFICWAQSCTHPKCIYSNMNENSRSQPFVKNAHTHKNSNWVTDLYNFQRIFRLCSNFVARWVVFGLEQLAAWNLSGRKFTVTIRRMHHYSHHFSEKRQQQHQQQ